MFSIGTAATPEHGEGSGAKGRWEALTESQLLRLPYDLALVGIEPEHVSLLLLRGHLEHRHTLLQQLGDGGVRARRGLRNGRGLLGLLLLLLLLLGNRGLWEGRHPCQRTGTEMGGRRGGVRRGDVNGRALGGGVIDSWPCGQVLGLRAAMAPPSLHPQHRRERERRRLRRQLLLGL